MCIHIHNICRSLVLPGYSQTEIVKSLYNLYLCFPSLLGHICYNWSGKQANLLMSSYVQVACFNTLLIFDTPHFDQKQKRKHKVQAILFLERIMLIITRIKSFMIKALLFIAPTLFSDNRVNPIYDRKKSQCHLITQQLHAGFSSEKGDLSGTRLLEILLPNLEKLGHLKQLDV